MRPLGAVAVVCIASVTACGALTAPSSKLATVASSAQSVLTTTSTTAPATTYVVVRGDTLTAIARRFGVTVGAIVAANHIASQDALSVGQVIHVPPVVPLGLTVSPGEGSAGTSFTLRLVGVAATDTVTFSVTQPGHHPYTGPQHSPAPDGTVSATYETYPTDPAGGYVVLARTSSGKGAFATFRVDPATTSPSVSR
ncbi:MAG TPA: LysM peptidoglycan-binding domain-containing protein [Acidimicrobiales bacterium]|nr:LysM peptidoglycan-binding domain-containing protein [Acidimicrobiales bacterium]